ncbi:hypothetical protein D9758_005381 [Tetrapyrgos nigripes]|uniref:Uncharacterized protein n=1 Tax=Tetrapyrgos nigripes TaxID=182062 RepID=A0A8H5GID4_9AGAR|nr:hypothetical protein D9758_005381 [Tetrapyrgos nigripes]
MQAPVSSNSTPSDERAKVQEAVDGGGSAVIPVNLAHLPTEIIEQIAERLCYPVLPNYVHNEDFLNEGRTIFSATRFHLSAWINAARRTCINTKHYAHPAASLPLLLRTLDQRPELAEFIRGVDLRWCEDDNDDNESYLETRRFLWMCERLDRLSVDSLSWTFIERVLAPSPDSLSRSALGISTFSTSCESRYMELLPTLFPRLLSLQVHLHGQRPPSRESELPISPNLDTTFTSRRKLLRLRVKLHVPADAPDAVFSSLTSRVLSLASTSVENLYVEGRPTLNNEAAPVLPTIHPPNCRNIRHLCLRDIDPFSTPSADPHHRSGVSSIPSELPLTCLSSLTHLLLIRPRRLYPKAFSLLPPSVKTVSFSAYGVDSKKSSKDSKTDFISSVVTALNYLNELCDCTDVASVRTVPGGRFQESGRKTLRLVKIKTYGAIPGDPWELGDLRSLMVHCKSAEPVIPFKEIGPGNAGEEPELILFFSSSSSGSSSG